MVHSKRVHTGKPGEGVPQEASSAGSDVPGSNGAAPPPAAALLGATEQCDGWGPGPPLDELAGVRDAEKWPCPGTDDVAMVVVL